MKRRANLLLPVLLVWITTSVTAAESPPLLAGAARVDVTNVDAGPVNDPLYVKALVLKSGQREAVLITVDAVAIGEIGPIGNQYLPTVRQTLQADFQIAPTNVFINASHCHGIVCADIAERTVAAVRTARQKLVPVRVGTGTGREDRIMENRRLKLKSGRTADVRHAYSLPPDDEIAEIGPVDPQIGILRLDRADSDRAHGQTVAVVYNFACHPIQGVPSGGNTADLIGFASRVIEDNLDEQTVALFVQGCGGDINPAMYKDIDRPRDAERLGNLLGLSALKAIRQIHCSDAARLQTSQRTVALPRADFADRIAALEIEQQKLLSSLRGTTMNLKTFLPLTVKYQLAEEFPSSNAHVYFNEKQLGRNDLSKLDADNRRNLKQYLENILVMEELTRTQTNLALLNKHQAQAIAAGSRTLDVEMGGLRVGDWRLLTFPGELTVQLGLNLKKEFPDQKTFVAGYTNGYIYYAPTAEQLRNPGAAQEDCDSLLAPEWEAIFETNAREILNGL